MRFVMDFRSGLGADIPPSVASPRMSDSSSAVTGNGQRTSPSGQLAHT